MVPTWFLLLIHVLADTQTKQISPKIRRSLFSTSNFAISDNLQTQPHIRVSTAVSLLSMFFCHRVLVAYRLLDFSQNMQQYTLLTQCLLCCLSNYSILSANSTCKKALLLKPTCFLASYWP